MSEKRELAGTINLAELAQKERESSETKARLILDELQATGGSSQSEIPEPEFQLNQTPLIQDIRLPSRFVNEGKNRGNVKNSRTWKEATGKRIQKKALETR